MFKFIINVQAEEDIARIWNYGFGQFGFEQANKYYDQFFEYFAKIAETPYIFPKAFRINEDYRFCVCGVDTIYFRIKNNTVEIMTIIGRQDYS